MMTRTSKLTLWMVVIAVLTASLTAIVMTPDLMAAGQAGKAINTSVPTIDFTKANATNARAWLSDKGFMLERAATDPGSTVIKFTPGDGLIFEALRPAQSFIALKKGHLEHYRDVELVWGVNKFPPGASYAQGKRNEAIMFYAFFGTDVIDSGSMIIPDSPYFLALHLCENDTLNKPELGRYFHKGGRFICVGKPKPGETITTRFDLKKAFEDNFNMPAPPLYGIALEFDTTGIGNGQSAAFVKSIRFPDAKYVSEQ